MTMYHQFLNSHVSICIATCKYTCTVKSCKYVPPLICMLALSEVGERAYSCDHPQSDKVRHSITQIPSMLAVVTVYTGLWTLISAFDI